MLPLWMTYPKQKREKGKILAPSKNLFINFSGSAQGPNSHKVMRFFSIKGASPRTFFPRFVKASMTLEAALVLPLFLLFFLTLGSSMEMFRLHSRVESALWEIGRETCVYGAPLKNSSLLKADAIPETLGNLALSYGYVKGRVEKMLGREWLEEAPIRGGASGLQYFGGAFLSEDDTMEFVVTYAVEPKWTVQGFRPFYLRNYYLGRAWTGFPLEEGKQGIFYLAENAQVYHLDVNCSHLKLSPKEVPGASVSAELNAKGSHYRACRVCAKGAMPGQVWISPEGDCYHYKRDCPGLKRTVRTVTRSEAEQYRPCSRCGKGKEE